MANQNSGNFAKCSVKQEGTPTNILLVAADVAIHTDSHDGSLQSTPHAQSLPIHNAKSTPSTVGGRDAVSTLCFIVTGLWASSTLASRSNVTTFSKRTPQGEVGWGHALKIKSQCEGSLTAQKIQIELTIILWTYTTREWRVGIP